MPGPMPRNSWAPPNGTAALYSGLLECPCTDRITKSVDGSTSGRAAGACPAGAGMATAAACRAAAAAQLRNAGLPSDPEGLVFTAGADPSMPAGCSLTVPAAGRDKDGRPAGSPSAFYNTATAAAQCGAASR